MPATGRQLTVPPPPPLPRDDGVRAWHSGSRGRGGTAAQGGAGRARTTRGVRSAIDSPRSEPAGLVQSAQVEGLGYAPQCDAALQGPFTVVGRRGHSHAVRYETIVGVVDRDGIEERPRHALCKTTHVKTRRTALVEIRRTAQRQLAGETVPRANGSRTPLFRSGAHQFCLANIKGPPQVRPAVVPAPLPPSG